MHWNCVALDIATLTFILQFLQRFPKLTFHLSIYLQFSLINNLFCKKKGF